MLLNEQILKPVNAALAGSLAAPLIDDGFPVNAVNCPQCCARAYIKTAGCGECIDCGFGTCEI